MIKIKYTKEALEEISNKLMLLEFALYKKSDGTKCKFCNTIQGKPKNGFKKYYCLHIRTNIMKKLSSINNKLLNKRLKSLFKEKTSEEKLK